MCLIRRRATLCRILTGKNGSVPIERGQPFGLASFHFLEELDWCGGGDLNPYALRRQHLNFAVSVSPSIRRHRVSVGTGCLILLDRRYRGVSPFIRQWLQNWLPRFVRFR